MMKMVNSYDSSFPNNLQRPTFNSSNLQSNTTTNSSSISSGSNNNSNNADYPRYKPQSPTSSQSLSSLNQLGKQEYDRRFIHANNKYPSPRVPLPSNIKHTDSFNSDSRTFVTKSLKQMKPLSFEKLNAAEPKTNVSETKTIYSDSNKTSVSDNDPHAKNFYQSSKEQTVKPISLNEKKHHSNHGPNSMDTNASDMPANEVVRVPRPKINKSYLIKMKRKHKNKISANLSGTKFDISKYSSRK